jgi:hypothetical protein
MGSDLVFYQLALVVLVWLFVMLRIVWPSGCGVGGHQPANPSPPLRQRARVLSQSFVCRRFEVSEPCQGG